MIALLLPFWMACSSGATEDTAEMVAQEFGWASPQMVTDLYGKSASRHAMKYLQQAWDATARPPAEAYLATAWPEDPP